MRYVIENQICFLSDNEPKIDIKWMNEEIGEQRTVHPLLEAYEGWIDYLDGEWAKDYINSNSGYYYVCYWFSNKIAMAKFRLMYGGLLGKDIFNY